MSNETATLDAGNAWASDSAQKRIRRRYAADRRLKIYGIAAIVFAVSVLAILVTSLILTGYSAFVQTKVEIPVFVSPEYAKPGDPAAGNYRQLTQQAIANLFPDVTNRRDQRNLQKLFTSDAPYIIRDYVLAHPDSIGKTIQIPISFSDSWDQLHKGVLPAYLNALHQGQVADFEKLRQRGVIHVEDGRAVVALDAYIDPAKVDSGDLAAGNYMGILQEGLSSYFGKARGNNYLAMLGDDAAAALKSYVEANPGSVGQTIRIRVPVTAHFATLAKGETPKVINPRFGSEQDLEWYRSLVKRDLVETVFAWELFLNADSRFPERAGLAGATVGSFFALLVCFLLSFPIAIAAAVYLEEFAPKNRLTDLIEVNINNLAAVPSVVFGLLGLAVFIGTFGMPRSAPLVGGMVLSLMTLPTIIIVTRAALKAVPPSIHEAALGIGASKHQVVLHHVLPLAMPGIMTGTIIGLAQALGETAPLLLIGMNAFIPSIENIGILEPATALPTQIFSWADSPERGFVARTSAAILILLGFLVLMNGVAIFLRQKFERKW